MKATASINLSQKKYSETYFENLSLNPGKYFMQLRTAHIQKEILFSDLRQFNREIELCHSARENRMTVEVSQRRGYKVVTFIA